ncbi:MAG TPA: phosphate ABC transporter permease PstA [Actinomycetota bacterium]|nr:phosphate ABC transporter permease PstA [Actinomycetota bacterium]
MSSPAVAARVPALATGRRAERSPGALAFHLALLLALLVALLTLATLLVDVATKGAGWLDRGFLSSLDSRFPERAGILPALVGTAWLMVLTAAISFPLGVGAAVYLEEMAPRNRLTAFLELNVANLAAVPSVIYGLLGLAAFVRAMQLGRSIMAGALTLVLLILPVIIVASREALRAVPGSIREAAYAVGATPWQVTWRQTLPAALPGMLTGLILGLSRAIGETAPLITLGALTYVNFVPRDPYDRFTAMPIQIYNWVSRPQTGYQHVAAAGIVLLLGVLLAMNALAVYLRNRYERRW